MDRIKPRPRDKKTEAAADNCEKMVNEIKKQRNVTLEVEDINEDATAKENVHSILPIDQVVMPAGDVTDLKDVFDAINKLCDTMMCPSYVSEDSPAVDDIGEIQSDLTVDLVSDSSSSYMYNIAEDCNEYNIENNESDQIVSETNSGRSVPLHAFALDLIPERGEELESIVLQEKADEIDLTGPLSIQVESCQSIAHPHTDWGCPAGQGEEVAEATSDGEPAPTWEGAGSELYYTASSEVSLVSEADPASGPEREECAAGHVAAMRERFESLTRAATPADLSRAVSPSLDRLPPP